MGVELYHQAQHNQCVTLIDLRALTSEPPEDQARELAPIESQATGTVPSARCVVAHSTVLGLAERRQKIPPLDHDSDSGLRDAADRLVHLYDAWSKKDKAEEWHKKLGENALDRGFPADPLAK